MGGISTWRDAAEFLLLGASSLQVCTAVMHYGFRIIEDLCDGLSTWMDSKGFATIPDLRAKSLHRISAFQNFDLSFRAVARIDPARCIRCNLCYVACNDTAHQCIDMTPQPVVREVDCVGCRLCYNVCPVENCISMVEVDSHRAPVTWDDLMKTRPEVANDWEAMERYRKEQGIEIH
jgi:dihydropyrimidine dehydrogenase (NAD+) subunit PreA